ncbi:MAG: SH3 domain-containing protein [Treponema sp.]|jgi:hypothetical protein|nr:SH3 domain-containing protein [Treponema sp.]
MFFLLKERRHFWGFFLFILITAGLFASCTRLLGWGVLLWSVEDPVIPSGTVLPVYIRSNIDQVWVAGIPQIYRRPEDPVDKLEIPLAQLELAGTKGAAQKRAEAFAPFALIYAETLQDGLPIRESPDNSARRTYRLKIGEIVKILGPAQGNPAISTTGDPLPGEWYQVLTEDGNRGYCFSYRLRLFEHIGGPLTFSQAAPEEAEDPELDRLLARTWSPEWYGTMINSGRIDLEDLSRQWRFFPGQDAGMARIYLPNLDRTFSYTGIRPIGNRSWRFEGASLKMSLRSDTVLEVQYTENGSALRTLLFVALPVAVEDIIAQETVRRDGLFSRIYAQGPAFNSTNYGTLSFSEGGRFTWTGYDRLIPRVIPPAALESGAVVMGLFLEPSLSSRYDGAFSLVFDRIETAEAPSSGNFGVAVHFMYTLDTQGLRIEYVPESSLNGVTVTRRAASPMIIYFFKADW